MTKVLLFLLTLLSYRLPSHVEAYNEVAFDEKCEGNEEAEFFFYKAQIDIDVVGSCSNMNHLLSMFKAVYEAIGRSTEETAALTSDDVTIYADKVTLDPAFCSEPVIDGGERRRLSPATTASKWSFQGGGEGVLCYPKVTISDIPNYEERAAALEKEIEEAQEAQSQSRRLLHLQQGEVVTEMDLEEDDIQAKIDIERLDFEVEKEEMDLKIFMALRKAHRDHGRNLPKEVKEQLEEDETSWKSELEAQREEMNERHRKWRRALRQLLANQKAPVENETEEFESDWLEKVHYFDITRAKLQFDHLQAQLLMKDENLAKEQLALANVDFYWILNAYRKSILQKVNEDLSNLWTQYGGECFDEKPTVMELKLTPVPTVDEAKPACDGI